MNLKIREYISLAEFTTFKVGGKARFFIEAENENQIIEALSFAEKNDLQIFILGGGSNVLIADEGFSGLVLKIALKGITFAAKNSQIVRVTAGAGEDWDNLVALTINENLQGFECLSGIPGLLGGTPVQNVGAYGQEISETIFSVKCFDRKTKKIVELSNEECRFAYRTSIFNSTEKNCYVVLAVTYNLKLNGEPKIVYRDLQNFFGERKPTLQETREAVLKIRRDKSMVIDRNDINSKSAGSFFKNPIVNRESFSELEKIAANLKIGNVPFFKVDEQNVKIPAAWLIEKAGFYKGFRKGKIGISTRHTLAIVNYNEADTCEIIDLKCDIQNKVEECFHIKLETEPVFIGFDELERGC